MWVRPWNMKEGFLVGGGLLVVGLLLQIALGPIEWRLLAWPVNLILLILLLGFVAYGLSIYFYVYAQRDLGAAKTSAYYAVAPFIGVLLSLIIFREIPGIMFFIALGIMILGTWLINRDCKKGE